MVARHGEGDHAGLTAAQPLASPRSDARNLNKTRAGQFSR
jgi:hypothetical protein